MWLFSQISLAQDHGHFPFQAITVQNGLSQNSVISIAQDSTGYLWLATQDGLNRYSGKDFVHYDKLFEDITRRTHARLGKVYIDRQHRLWIVTDPGSLERYRPASDDFIKVPHPQGISALYQTTNLDFYLGTHGKGLFKIGAKTGDTTQIFSEEDRPRTVYDLMERNDSLWVASSGKLFVLEGQGTYSEIRVRGGSGAVFSALEQSGDGGLWLGSYDQGLFHRPPGAGEFVPFEHGDLPRDLNIQDLLVDREGRLWIATYGDGAFLYDPRSGRMFHFTEHRDDPFAIHYNDLLSLYQDNSGTIWIGSDGAGANYYDSHHIKFNILTNDQLPKNTTVDVIRSITSDGEGNLWLGTSGKGLTRANPKKGEYVTYNSRNRSLPSGRVLSLAHDGADLWIGYQGFGLNIGNPETSLRSFPEIAHHTLWKIVPRSPGQHWLCTESHGLILFDKTRGIQAQYTRGNSLLATNNIRTIEKGDRSQWWIGTEDSGLYLLDETQGEIRPIGAVGDKIKSLYWSSGTLWIGTNGNGMKGYRPETGEILHITKAQGLPNQVVYGILPDEDQNLWLSTNKGISRFDTQDHGIVNYTNPVYLQSYEFNTGAYHRDRDGILYFGGLKGLNWFDPGQLGTSPVRPRTVITKMELFNSEHPMARDLVLRHDQNTLSFTFASLQFSQPGLNQYRYRLKGNDRDWMNAGNDNVVRYTNLAPGAYEFEAFSSNYDGLWGQVPARYAFHIRKPWYTTHLALAGYGTLLLACAIMVYRFARWRGNVKHQRGLERDEMHRMKKNDEMKTQLYANISHEFRTPLALISGPVENQLGRGDLSDRDKRELQLIKHNTDRLLGLIDQMTDLSVLASGQRPLRLAQGNLNGLLMRIVEAFQYRANQEKITLRSTVQGLHRCWYDAEMVTVVVTNLLSNALKYSPENSRVAVEAMERDGALLLMVMNDIRPKDNPELPKLFRRFYQQDSASEGMGIGLALVKELVELARGTISVNALENKRIQFVVTLPINRTK